MTDIIIWEYLILYQYLFSPQVKQTVIINKKHGIYELPCDLPNNLRLQESTKDQANVKTSSN